MSVHKGGRGGQKRPKIRPHGLWMTPYDISLRSIKENLAHDFKSPFLDKKQLFLLHVLSRIKVTLICKKKSVFENLATDEYLII